MHDEQQSQPHTSGSQAPWGGGVRPAQNLQPTVPGIPGDTHQDEREWQSKMNEHKLLHFPTQRPNEHVILLLRRHWTVLAGDVTQLVASLILPPLILTLLFIFTDFSLDPTTPIYVILVEALSLYYLFSFLAYFHDFVDYHLDIWVVTDQRVVSIEQEGLFNRVVSELNITRIQDVSSQMRGKVQTFLDYGSVHIQTAGEAQRFVFEQVSHPAEVAKVILQVHDRALKMEEARRMREASKLNQAAERLENNPMFQQNTYGAEPQITETPPYTPPTAQQQPYAPQQMQWNNPQQYAQPTTEPQPQFAQPSVEQQPVQQPQATTPQPTQVRRLSPQQRREQLHQSPVQETGQQKQDNSFGPLDY